MELNENIAQVDLGSQTCRIKRITFYVKNLRFKCKRCATFCCKLGGPTLSLKDIERLKKVGHSGTEFLDAHRRLKSTVNGSCAFLRFDAEKRVYECAVYDYRPALCRLYPFHFEKASPHRFMLKIMPCLGISNHDGELIDEKFIFSFLLGALKDICF